jgi:hypothetical protein
MPNYAHKLFFFRVTRYDCEKVAQNKAQPYFTKLIYNVYLRNKGVQNFGLHTSVIFTKLPTINNQLLSKKTPNLVTLLFFENFRFQVWMLHKNLF